MAFPATQKEEKNLNYCSPQGGMNQLRLWPSQGAAVRHLKFSSGVFCFLSTPVPVVSEHAGLPLSLSEHEPFLQGVAWLEMVLRAQKAASCRKPRMMLNLVSPHACAGGGWLAAQHISKR